VTDFAKSVLRGNRICPALNRRTRDFDRTTAGTAEQVVVVAGRAAAIRRLTVAGPECVEVAGISHQLQGPIDRRQTDAFAVLSQILVNLLGRPEVVTIGKDFLDRSTLPRPALRTTRGHLRLFCRHGISRHLDAPRRIRRRCSVLIVVISMGSMPMTFVDEIGVVAMLHCRMATARRMAMGVAFGDHMRGDQLIVVD
jgi:hypothetical protein